MMAGIYCGAMYGGSTTSILLNIPGEAASVVTCIDGYKMAKNGRAGAVMGISAIGSFIAGAFGIVALTFMGPLILAFVLGRILERSLSQALIISSGDVSVFVTKPISAVLLGIVFLMLLTPLVLMLRRNKTDRVSE